MSRLRRPALLTLLISLVITPLTLSINPTSASAVDPPPCNSTPVPGKPADKVKPADKRPPANGAIRHGTYFSYLGRGTDQQIQIRNRVLNTINSTWGRRYTTPQYATYTNSGLSCQYVSGWNYTQGTIRMATWSMNDSGIYNALAKAVQRGTLVQMIAAQQVNRDNRYKPWAQTYSYLNSKWAHYYHPDNRAVECRGSCRGSGGTPHSKYFLFSDVGWTAANPSVPAAPYIAVQTSMNLTAFAYQGQWNSAVAIHSKTIYDRYKTIFHQASYKYGAARTRFSDPQITDYFYPGGQLNTANDEVLRTLSGVRSCTGAQSGGINGRTRIRAIQYALYDTRGVAIAKRLRALWNAGCNVAVIYSVTSKPVLSILRAKSGRGPVPMKQSVYKNRAGDIVKYNHSKWLAISGNYNGNPNAWVVMSGSANWSNFAYYCDEQMQTLNGYGWVAPFIRTFDTTWRQGSSRPPSSNGNLDGARVAAAMRGGNPHTFGYGIFRYMDND